MTADVNGTRPEPAGAGIPPIFRESLSLVHSLLVIHYRFTEENARDAESDLQVWFERMERRAPRDRASLREALLVAACEYARSTQLWRLGGRPSGDSRFDDFLSRDPREVAREIMRRMESS